MRTFRSIYCERHGCDERGFVRNVFEETVYAHARPFVWLLGGFGGRYFKADRELIDIAGRITALGQLETETSSYLMDADNRWWLRRVARVRVSTRRLSRCARCCFCTNGRPFDVNPPQAPR